MLSDFHMHSSFSSDSSENVDNIINKAITLGMESICITDHYDMDFPIYLDEPEMDFKLDFDSYYKLLSEKRDEYKDKIDLKLGIELGFMPTTANKLNIFVDEHPEYDFFIGSLHVIDWVDPWRKDYFNNKTDVQAYYHYFDTILDIAKTFKNYNVLGHLDYILRYGPSMADNFNINDYKEVFVELFKMIIPEGKGIELNTAGLYKGLGFIHPHIDILKLYKEAGGKIITVGSDAHKAENIGYGFEQAKDLLLANGFDSYCTFSKQQPEFHKL